jgi:hypothetical protein
MKVVDIINQRGESFGNLTVYPITMRHYEELHESILCLTLMQKKFGIELASMPYLRMLLYLSNEEVNLLAMLSKVLSLSLHIKEEQIRLKFDNGKASLLFLDGEAENANIIETVSELRFSKLRRIIAEQNSIKLPNEKANLEILESEEDLAAMNSLNLNVDFADLFFSVATYCGLSTEAMLDMTIFEFEKRVSAVSRISKYEMFGQGEMSGFVSFKNGNPYPSWCFDKTEDGLHGTIPLAQFEKRVSNVVETTN